MHYARCHDATSFVRLALIELPATWPTLRDRCDRHGLARVGSARAVSSAATTYSSIRSRPIYRSRRLRWRTDSLMPRTSAAPSARTSAFRRAPCAARRRNPIRPARVINEPARSGKPPRRILPTIEARPRSRRIHDRRDIDSGRHHRSRERTPGDSGCRDRCPARLSDTRRSTP